MQTVQRLVIVTGCLVSLFTHFCHGQWNIYQYCQAPTGLVRNPITNDLDLIMIQAVVRHGDRVPGSLLPGNASVLDEAAWYCNLSSLEIPTTDPSSASATSISRLYHKVYLEGREALPGNCTLAQLTETGAIQHQVLGQSYRKRYIYELGLLSENYVPGEIWVRSTDIPGARTMQSAENNLLGLYPPENRMLKSNEIQVIPINTMDFSMDNMVPNPLLCPQITALQGVLEASPDFLQVLEAFADDIMPLCTMYNISGGLVGCMQATFSFFDNCAPRVCHGIPLIPGMTVDFLNAAAELAQAVQIYLTNSTQLKMLTMGSFVAELWGNVQQALIGEELPKFRLYVGHDTTLTGLLFTMGVGNFEEPPYASHIELELWLNNSTGEYYLALNFNGNALQLPGCSSTVCPIGEFSNSIAPILPYDYTKQCQVSSGVGHFFANRF